eukprot:scaffold41331_cov65-Phaeocystis_antarctica.AAC.6
MSAEAELADGVPLCGTALEPLRRRGLIERRPEAALRAEGRHQKLRVRIARLRRSAHPRRAARGARCGRVAEPQCYRVARAAAHLDAVHEVELVNEHVPLPVRSNNFQR